MQTKWILPQTPTAEQVDSIVQATGANRLVAAVLAVRGFTPDEAQSFLDKSEKNLFNPFLFCDMQKAVDRINQALSQNEKITVYGDYDADGVTATALLVSCLKELGAVVDYYIPEREFEGYGMSGQAVERIAQNGTKLIISVDCGITATQECEIAKGLGVDVIITDHHECGDQIPNAVAVIDPKTPGEAYPDKGLAGVGVALKLCQALQKEKSLWDTACRYAEYVALGTVADIAPLTGENRVLCDIGLKKMRTTSNLGFQALLKSGDLTDKVLDTTKLGFQIAPKINAVGRLEHAAQAVELFLTQSVEQAENLAQNLEICNQKRQQIEMNILEQAERMAQEYANDTVLVLCNKGWHHGVVGIVSSRLTKKFNKPCIMISPGADGLYKGSGRSLEGFSLFDALSACKAHLVRFGGHELAAGLVIEKDKVNDFRTCINQYANEILKDNPLVPVLRADCALRGRHLNLECIVQLEALEPFGTGNKQPVFVISDMTVQRASCIGSNGQHLKMQLEKDGCSIDAIAFSFGDKIKVDYGSTVTVMANLEKNVFRGNENPQLKIIDIKQR